MDRKRREMEEIDLFEHRSKVRKLTFAMFYLFEFIFYFYFLFEDGK